MSWKTHASGWRLLVAGAPLLGVAFIVFAVAQGEPEFARSTTVYGVLLALAGAGCLAAWHLARRLGATAVVPIAAARPGYVAFRGHAEPLPGAPFTSPTGQPCVWFARSEGRGNSRHATSRARDSARPFLLRDESGSCIVAPSRADITGGQETGDASGRERLIRAGDPLYVAGQLRDPSPELIESLTRELQASAARSAIVEQFDSAQAMQAAQDRRDRAETDVAAARAQEEAMLSQAVIPALPVVGAPEGIAPFVISADSQDGGASFYRWLAGADAMVALACLLALSWLRYLH